MHLTFSLRIILCAGIILCTARLCSQADELQLDEWISELSVKRDPKFLRYRGVMGQIETTDTAKRCAVIGQLVERASHENVYCRIRANCIRLFALGTADYYCDELKRHPNSEDPLQLAHIAEDPYLVAFSHRILAGMYRVQGDYGMATMHLMLSMEAQEALGFDNFFEVAFTWYALGEMQYHGRAYESAVQSLQKAVAFDSLTTDPSQNKLSPTDRMFLYNTLGLAYEKLAQYDSADMAFKAALRWATLSRYAYHWVPLINGNRGDIFYQQGRYDSAFALLKEDVRTSLEGGAIWADNAANSMHWLARIKTKWGKPREALADLRAARQVLKLNPSPRVLTSIYQGYMEAYEALNQTDSLFYYTQLYLTLHDSIEHKAAEARADIVQMRLDNQNSIQRIKELNKEKRRITLIRNITILFALMSFAFGVLYFNRQRLRTQLRQQKMLEAKNKAEAEAASAREQLDIFTQHLLAKNTMVETLQAQLMQKEFDDAQAQTISELSQHTILTDADWERFKILFEKVYPGFFHRVKTAAPDITFAELRLAALSKLRIYPKEAATLLGISHASVIKTRQRLRNRLELNQVADLEEFINSTM